MRMNTITALAAVAFAFTAGEAVAGDRLPETEPFAALDGIPAQVMSAPAMASVVGAAATLIIDKANASSAVGGTGITTMPNQAAAGLLANPNTGIIWVCPTPGTGTVC